jgi:hypothetical protein
MDHPLSTWVDLWQEWRLRAKVLNALSWGKSESLQRDMTDKQTTPSILAFADRPADW